MAKSDFQHLPLPFLAKGPAKLGRPPRASEQTRNNRSNFRSHAEAIKSQVDNFLTNVRPISETIASTNIPAGVALVLEVDPVALDLDKLRHFFDFEIVLEDDDGFVIVASEDLDLARFTAMVDAYASDTRGSATIASIYSVDDDEDQVQRLRRILSDRLFRVWPKLSSVPVLIVDVGVECVGNREIPDQPERRKRDSDVDWARRELEWSQQRLALYEWWDELYASREEVIRELIDTYGGEILDSHHAYDAARLPDSFTVRIKIKGAGLRDLVLNFPYIFDVVEPDDVEIPEFLGIASDDKFPDVEINSPTEDAPAVCIIDSGIQEGHPLIQPAMDASSSHCFLPSDSSVADHVRGGGHGTRVAGAILYAETIPKQGLYDARYWLQNARVLDGGNKLPRTLFPPVLMEEIVNRFHSLPRPTKIFNQSINANSPCRTKHMSAWAAAIDKLSYDKDVLFIQSVGNVLCNTFRHSNPGVAEHLAAGRNYPDFQYENSFRAANPAQSFQAITVGSVSYGLYSNAQWRSFSSKLAESSAFSRSGLGIWGVTKPDVVEFGGDYLLSESGDVSTPDAGSSCYPETVRSTLHGGPAAARDAVGTSLSAPKVAHIAAALQDTLPDEPCLLYRALIVQSARWPEWAYEVDDRNETIKFVRSFGYGIPDIGRATSNTLYRSTLISQGEQTVRPNEARVFQIPIPSELRQQGDDFDIQIEVTLSYAAQPRRTRRGYRNYLSTWLEWKTCGLREPVQQFRERIFKDEVSDENGNVGSIPWQMQKRINDGIVGVRRTAGTIQKDWAIVKNYELPDTFCVAVIAHKGWSNDPDTVAKFAIAVSFESVTQELEIHEPLEVAVEELMVELESQAELTG